MTIVISDAETVAQINQLAKRLNQTPEQVIARALEYCYPEQIRDRKAFWNSIRGIGDSGDPDLANQVKEIRREEIDPIEGWGNNPRPEQGTVV